MAQPLRTTQTESATLKLVKVCRVCGGPLNAKSYIGICYRNEKCAKLAKQRHARLDAEERRTNKVVRTCKKCGGPVGDRNTTGVCYINPACVTWNRNKKYADAHPKKTPKPCKQCSGPLGVRATTDYCTQTAACRSLNLQVRTQRSNEENGEVRQPRFCIVCETLLHAGNTTNVCRSNPDCRAHSVRLLSKDQRERIAIARVQSGRQRLCIRCQFPLRKNNKTDYCMENKTCEALHHKEYQRKRREKAADKFCEICGARMRSNSIHKVCQRTPACRKESHRRRYDAYRENDIEAARQYARDYAKKHPERIAEHQAQAAVRRGKIATIPTASRVLTKQFVEVSGLSLRTVYWYLENPDHAHPALGRPIQTWPDGKDRKPYERPLFSIDDARTIAAWKKNPDICEPLPEIQVEILALLSGTPKPMLLVEIADAINRSSRSLVDDCKPLRKRGLIRSLKGYRGIYATEEGRRLSAQL